MRADRLVSLVLLLRQRGRLTAEELAAELEVSTRTVLRDIEALSAAGVPVYAERGRHGGFALLPGFRAELTGLSHDEALALLTAGSGRAEFGLGPALASAIRKVVDAIPDAHRTAADDANRRLLVEPAIDLLARRADSDRVPAAVMTQLRQAVLAGRKLRIQYAAKDREPRWRMVDPIGLVTARGRGYLLAIVDGSDRTYRLSRIVAAEALDEPAQRPDQVDLEGLWAQRSTDFRHGGNQLTAQIRLAPERREEVIGTALAVLSEQLDSDGWSTLEVTFQDDRHAAWALWQLGADAAALSPESLRDTLFHRAAAMAAYYAP